MTTRIIVSKCIPINPVAVLINMPALETLRAINPARSGAANTLAPTFMGAEKKGTA